MYIFSYVAYSTCIYTENDGSEHATGGWEGDISRYSLWTGEDFPWHWLLRCPFTTWHLPHVQLNNILVIVWCTGCLECLHKCNVELKEKLRVLFPTCEQRILDQVLPVEDGKSSFSHALLHLILQCYIINVFMCVVSTVRRGYAVHLIQTRWRAFVRKRNETIQIFQGRERRSLIVSTFTNYNQCLTYV